MTADEIKNIAICGETSTKQFKLFFNKAEDIANLCAKTMDYRGLGSGIIYALKADANIEFQNESSGDQFRAILWRTEQETTQKTEGSEVGSEKSNLKSDLKSDLKSSLKIIELLKVDGTITIPDIQSATGLSRSGVKKILAQLKESGKIRRVGLDKGGHWEVCE